MAAETERERLSLQPRARRPSAWASIMWFVRRKPLGAWGAVTLLILILAAILAEHISPYSAYEMSDDRFAAPGAKYLLGTDEYGRDVLSRVILGARVSLIVGLGVIALGGLAGAAIGLTTGYFGGKYDLFVQRIMDAMMSFPTLVLALCVVVALGPSMLNVIIAIALIQTPRCSRVVRSSAIAIKESEYVQAARCLGASEARILAVHIFPNCLAPLFIFVSAALGEAILTEATMSFLGLGTPAPIPSWGSMLSIAGREFVAKAPWLAIFPGIAITLAVFGINLLGDSLRDVLDPRLRT